MSLTHMTIVSTTVGKNPLDKNPHSPQKSLKCSTWVQSQKWQNDLCLFPRQTIQYQSNPKSMPLPVILKKLKLNGSMKIYETF